MDTNRSSLEEELAALRSEAPNPDETARLILLLQQRTLRSNLRMKLLKLSTATVLTLALIGVALVASPKASAEIPLSKVSAKLQLVRNYHIKSYAITGDERTLASEMWVLDGKARKRVYAKGKEPVETFTTVKTVDGEFSGEPAGQGDRSRPLTEGEPFRFIAGGTLVPDLITMLRDSTSWKAKQEVKMFGSVTDRYVWDLEKIMRITNIKVAIYIDRSLGLPRVLSIEMPNMGCDRVEDVYDYDTVAARDVTKRN